MAPVPAGAQRSEDGYYWWDGTTWQQIPEEERTATSSASASASGSTSPDGMSHEELAQITSEDQLDDKSKPYFQPDPDKYPDDDSAAEGADQLSDEPASNAAGGVS